nr:NAD(+) diphosphatase [Leekyejoonella antrihumi]
MGDVPATSQTPFDLILTRATHDRAGTSRRDEQLLPRLLADPATQVVDLWGDRVVLDAAGQRLAVRPPEAADAGRLAIYLGVAREIQVVAVVRDLDDAPGETHSLRSAGMQLGDDVDVSLVTTAVGIVNWHARQGFCPRCGAPTTVMEAGWVRRCTVDGSEDYPRTDAAVIMSVVDDDDRLLLAHGTRFRGGVGMSVLAGFVEPGESLEAAVEREVMEEVGVPVTDVRYLGNQPWPFPASLMVGFTARATATTLRTDPVEISAARWFSREEFAQALKDETLTVPARLSIARHLIEHWYGGPVSGLWKHS